MSTPSARLAELGLTLPEVAPPVAAYIPARRLGSTIYTSGQLPFVSGHLGKTGHVGGEVTAEEAAAQARVCAINAIAAAAQVAGGVDNLKGVIKVVVFVASAPGFTAQPAVGNGASEVLVEVFGESGRHSRSAVGVAELPLGAPVEVEAIFEI